MALISSDGTFAVRRTVSTSRLRLLRCSCSVGKHQNLERTNSPCRSNCRLVGLGQFMDPHVLIEPPADRVPRSTAHHSLAQCHRFAHRRVGTGSLRPSVSGAPVRRPVVLSYGPPATSWTVTTGVADEVLRHQSQRRRPTRPDRERDQDVRPPDLRRVDSTTLQRYGAMMPDARRTTIYFDHHLYRALRLKAVEVERSVSDLVNEAVRLRLAEDAEDLAAFDDRADEPNLKFEEVLKDLRRSGKI